MDEGDWSTVVEIVGESGCDVEVEVGEKGCHLHGGVVGVDEGRRS